MSQKGPLTSSCRGAGLLVYLPWCVLATEAVVGDLPAAARVSVAVRLHHGRGDSGGGRDAACSHHQTLKTPRKLHCGEDCSCCSPSP